MNSKALTALGFLLFLGFGWVSFAGCPTTPPTEGVVNPDGSNPPTPDTPAADTATTDTAPPKIECTAGNACILVGGSGMRACEFLLAHNKAIAGPEISFHEGVIGTSRHLDKKLAIAFVMRKDEALTAGQSHVVVKLPDGVKELALEKSTCYDRNGAPIEKIDVQLQKP